MAEGDTGEAPQRVALQISVALGGCAALSWEVLWQIKSSLALGVSAWGTAITVATTMAGMSIGSLVGGRLITREPPARSARLYGRLELLIGLAGLAMPAGFALLERLDGWVYGLAPSLAPGVHALGIALLLGPPTMAMGATVPVFGVLSARFGTSLSRLYAINTAGAALGVLAFTFVAVPSLGLGYTVALVAGFNFAVFAAVRGLREPAGAGGNLVDLSRPAGIASTARLPLVLAFGTGFVTFGLEVAWFRSLRAVFQSSADSFAIILAAVLIPLAIGARLVPRLRGLGLSPAALLGAAGVAILLATPLVERMDLLAEILPNPVAGPVGYTIDQILRFALALAILGPPILVLGTVLPWLLDELPAPAHAGRLYGANTVGAASGSLLAAWSMLPTLGFARSAWLLGGFTVLLALAAGSGRVRRTALPAGALALAVAVAASSSVGIDRVLSRYSWSSYRILAYDEGPDSTVSVVEPDEGRFLLIDGFAASAEDVDWGNYTDLMGRLPMRIHRDPRDALVIGFGTGQTAHGVRDEGPRSLRIAELNRAVLDVAPLFSSNHGVLDDPAVRAVVMDGRAWLRRTQERYDVISLEPMPPHFAGVNALYSREFYEILRRRLRPGGIACQWVPLHLLPPYYAASVTRTFQSVFPHAEMWVVPNVQGILLGRVPREGEARDGEGRASFDRFAMRHSSDELDEDTELRLGPRALARYGAEGDVISDDNQLLSYGRVSAEMRLYLTPGRLIRRNYERILRLASEIEY
jgi:spermidine synthase